TALLQTLNEHDSLEHVSRMMQGIRVYQHAGSAENGNQSWYATLPYYLDQRQEQLEAKYEQSAANSQEPNKRQQWQLQLKFNLSSGALLAKAQMQEHGVSLHFIGSSQLLIDKVSSNVEMLGKKLTQLGLAPSEISAHVARCRQPCCQATTI
ncbi:MAG: flagellar hook-length control protein FliK, partial [Shewanella fodinae]|nr:flagellar hook-length control protein FliK [Shewanella fodinae]